MDGQLAMDAASGRALCVHCTASFIALSSEVGTGSRQENASKKARRSDRII
jgi:hypothetical protein